MNKKPKCRVLYAILLLLAASRGMASEGVYGLAEDMLHALKGTGETLPIPEVQHHSTPVALVDLEYVCKTRIETHGAQCALVTYDDKVCFSFIGKTGRSSSVHCFPDREQL